MLAGALPFAETDTDFDIMRKVVEGEIPPPDELNPDIPSGLAQWVVGAIRKDQDDRYQSAEEMLEALHEADRQVDATQTQPEWEVDPGGDTDETQTVVPPDEAPTQPGRAGEEDAGAGPAEETVLDPDVAPPSGGPVGPDEPSPSEAAPSTPDTPSDDSAPEKSTPEEKTDAGDGLNWTAVAGGLVAALLVGVLAVFAVARMGGTEPSASLSLTTTPSGATVLVNGDTAGTTPLGGYALEAGAVQLKVEKDGHRPVDSSFTIEQGGQVVLGDLSLPRTTAEPEAAARTADAETTDAPGEEPGIEEESSGEEGPSEAQPEQTESTATSSASSTDESGAGPATGTVAVTVQPVGTAEVDGASPGSGTVELSAGEHTVTCRHPNGATVDTTLSVAAGETRRLTCYTEVTVNVTTTGAWGRVWLNGQNTEINTNTGESLSLPPGRHRIRVRRRSDDDFQIDGGVVKIERGERSRKVEFSESRYELEGAPSFKPVEHAVVFNDTSP